MKLLAGTLLSLLIQAIVVSPTMACPFEDYLSAERQGPSNPKSPNSLYEHEARLTQAFEQDSRRLFGRYLNQELDVSTFDDCDTQSPDLAQRLNQDFASLFLEEAALRLQKDSKLTTLPFATSALEYIHSTSVYPVKLIVRSDAQHSAHLAGYDRQSRGLFFNIAEIKPENWEQNFIHVFAHALDSKLRVGIKNYADPAVVNPAIEVIRRNPPTLTADETETLIRYLRAGADRGLFAEYRAWVVTSFLLDPTLSKLPEIKKTWWNRLKKSFPIPDEGVFKHPLMRQAHQIMIDRVDPLTEDFGALAVYLK